MRTNTIVQIEAVREYYRCAFRPNDQELTVDQVNEFIEYMQLFYCGEEAIYPYDFSIEEICGGMIDRMAARPSFDWEGDSVDRELVRDLILDVRERVAA